jgi:hypothetical protein
MFYKLRSDFNGAVIKYGAKTNKDWLCTYAMGGANSADCSAALLVAARNEQYDVCSTLFKAAQKEFGENASYTFSKNQDWLDFKNMAEATPALKQILLAFDPEAFTDKRLKRIVPYQQEWGGYVFNLHVDSEHTSPVDREKSTYQVSSPELSGFTLTYTTSSGVIAVNSISDAVDSSLSLNHGITDAAIYYAQDENSTLLIDGKDEIAGLTVGRDCKIIVVPQGVSLPNNFTIKPKQYGTKGTCPIYSPAFK